jgi:hypothetical protein
MPASISKNARRYIKTGAAESNRTAGRQQRAALKGRFFDGRDTARSRAMCFRLVVRQGVWLAIAGGAIGAAGAFAAIDPLQGLRAE